MHTTTTREKGARTMAHQRRRQQAREQHERATFTTVRTQVQTTRETATAAHALEPRGKKPVKIGENTDWAQMNLFPEEANGG